jgi:hypothetical protein
MQVKWTMQYDVPATEQDPAPEDPALAGITPAGYDRIHKVLAELGMDDITVTKE